jgi:HlyD family secretion protein
LWSKVQADADQNRVEASEINLRQLNKQMDVLVNYTKGRNETDLKAKLVEAIIGVKKANLEAEFTLKYLEADRDTKRAIFDLEVTRQADIEDQIDKCSVRAPQDGLVVYFVPEQVKGGGGTQQSIVSQGEPVRESQKMLQIPDLNKMLVNVRVPEAFVSKLHSEGRNESKWQIAQIKVDAHQNQMLIGHVKFVDLIASTTDWFAADVKVYKTLVAIDTVPKDPSTGKPLPLKPGMSAEVTITASDSRAPVLVVPIQSVVGTISSGADRQCFVVGPDGQAVKRDIKVGLSNERLVEVISGLVEGERVVENPRPLLEEGSELKPGKTPRGKGEDGGGTYEQKKPGGPGGTGKKGGGVPPGPGVKVPDGQKVGALVPALLPAPRQWVATASEDRYPTINQL